jgi:hypothetical protein
MQPEPRSGGQRLLSWPLLPIVGSHIDTMLIAEWIVHVHDFGGTGAPTISTGDDVILVDQRASLARRYTVGLDTELFVEFVLVVI